MFGRIDRDAWFTPVSTATSLVGTLLETYPEFRDKEWFEPSAGSGTFIQGLINNGIPLDNITAIDLDPIDSPFPIEQADFFSFTTSLKGKIVIGNPPYGYRNNLTVKFIKYAFSLGAEYVVFLLMGSVTSFMYINRINYAVDKAFLFDAVQFKDNSGRVLGNCSNNNTMIVFKNSDFDNSVSSVIEYGDINNANYLSHYGALNKISNNFDRNRKVVKNGPNFNKVEGYERWMSSFLCIDEKNFDPLLFSKLTESSVNGRVVPNTYNYWDKHRDNLVILDNVPETKNKTQEVVFKEI